MHLKSMTISNRQVNSNNTDGTAVARDLAKALENSKKVMSYLESGHYKFNMGKAFILKINKLSD